VRAVHRHPDFEADYLAQLDWLVAQGEQGWIAILAEGLDSVVELLSSFPAAGAPEGRSGRAGLRKIVFPRGPYVAWYVYDADDPAGAVWLLRLFHVRQEKPRRSRRR
jgi:hypothetical protein